MDPTVIGALACRGALELPNDPFKALADMSLPDPRKVKLTRSQRARAYVQAAAWCEYLRVTYGG
jgi:hypothetical protein